MADESYWINIGRMFHTLYFHCFLKRRPNSKLGYHLQMKVVNPHDDVQGNPLATILGSKKEEYTSRNDLRKIILFIEKIDNSYSLNLKVKEKTNYKLIKYCLDNPPNYENWDAFVAWVEEVEEQINEIDFIN